MDQKSGLFVECEGGLLSSLSGLPSFKRRVLGLQKATTRDNIDKFYRCFGYTPALIEGSDPKSISDIGKGDKQTYLKIGEYSYSTIKFALQDSANRVSDCISKINHGFIESIKFQGGKFDGQEIFFSPGLNTIIGIRGSGKSAVLEVVRYVLGFSAQIDEDYKDSLVKNVLGSGGKAILSVFDKHNKRYLISRIYGEKICVIDENKNELNIKPLSILDGVQYFGQRDLSNSTDHENSLLEKFVSEKVDQYTTIDRCIEELSVAVEGLLNASKIPDQLDEVRIQQNEIEHKMSIFTEKGVAEKLNKQATYTKDQTKLSSVKDAIDNAVQSFKEVYENHKPTSNALEDYESEYNSDLIDAGKKFLGLIDEELIMIKNSIQSIQARENDFSKIIQNLDEGIHALSDEFAEIKREIKDESIDADTFVQLTANMEKTKVKIKLLKEKEKSRSTIEESFAKAAKERNAILQQIFQAYQAEIEHINDNQEALRIEIFFKGNREEFKARLKNDFRGSGISDSKYQVMSERFEDYVSLIEDWLLSDGEKLNSILTPSEYSKLSEKLCEQYNELLKYQIPNKVDIYYHKKLLRKHSIGQRASALILFILTQNNNDIILIDQPEDDLDNKVIYNEVINAISKMKSDVQFIFATHNANIPVLGDSEKVLAVEYQDTVIDIAQGNIDLDNTHNQIVDIMEGGKEAFEKRQLIYEAWR